jgi:hypothetical protein
MPFSLIEISSILPISAPKSQTGEPDRNPWMFENFTLIDNFGLKSALMLPEKKTDRKRKNRAIEITIPVFNVAHAVLRCISYIRTSPCSSHQETISIRAR